VRNAERICYSQLLEQKLREAHPGFDIRVLNAGGDGFSSAHSLANFSLRCLDVQPDIVTVYHNINDVSAAYYPGRAAPDYANKYRTNDFVDYRFRSGFAGTLTRYSYLARYVNARTGLFRVRGVDRKADPADAVRLLRRNLAGMRALAAAHGIRIAIGTQAARSDQRADPGFAAANEAVRALCGEKDIPLFDLEAALRDDALFLDEVHFTSDGVRGAADEILKAVGPLVEKAISGRSAAD
jgi:lysophospholipase L1-like esterase